MRKYLAFFIMAFVLVGCQRLNIGPKGEGEYVIASAEIPYSDIGKSALKEQAMPLAEKSAVEKATRVFLSSANLVQYPEAIKSEIFENYKTYVRNSYSTETKQKGDKFYLEAKVMVLVSDLSAKVKEIEESNIDKKANIIVASRETLGEEVSLKQYCRQGIYKALKAFPYNLLDGGNLSKNNLESPTSFIDKAKKEGARFVILADATTSSLESAAALTTTFKPIRAKVSLQVLSTNNYQVIAESSESATGLDAVQSIAEQKALNNACESAAKQVEEEISRAVNSAKVFRFIIEDVNTIERLEKLQNIMRSQRDVEDFSLVEYRNGTATFEVQAQISTAEEFSAKILRKNMTNFLIERTSADLVEMRFL